MFLCWTVDHNKLIKMGEPWNQHCTITVISNLVSLFSSKVWITLQNPLNNMQPFLIYGIQVEECNQSTTPKIVTK